MRRSWIIAAVLGCIGALGWWVPSDRGEPFDTALAWFVWVGVAASSALAAYLVGERGRRIASAALVGAASTFLALPLVLGTVFALGVLVEVAFG